jgi:photosystem II protein PsbQ
MVKYRSVVSVLLATVIAVLMVFGNPVAQARTVKAPTYTSEQLEQIQVYASELSAIRDRLPELGDLIKQEDWVFTRNFIHGPLGDFRFKMLSLSRLLLPNAQTEARKLAKAVFDDLIAIDLAAQDRKYQSAVRGYAEIVKDFDAFLQLVPQG